MTIPFARIAIRNDEEPDTVILGKNFRKFLEPGAVYEITEILGILTIRKVGVSCATLIAERRWNAVQNKENFDEFNADVVLGSNVSWASTIDMIAENGDHLLTVEEVTLRTKLVWAEAVANNKYSEEDIPPSIRNEVLTIILEKYATTT
jgi:hypothetical protein